MTDKTDPRLDVAMARVNDRHYLTTSLAAGALLTRLDEADRAAGIVRVDTNDEALVERLARRAFESWYQGEFGESPAAHVSTGYGFERDTRAFLAALREAS